MAKAPGPEQGGDEGRKSFDNQFGEAVPAGKKSNYVVTMFYRGHW